MDGFFIVRSGEFRECSAFIRVGLYSPFGQIETEEFARSDAEDALLRVEAHLAGPGPLKYPLEMGGVCGVVFFTSPFHLGGRHARPFTRNLEGECARGGMNFVSVLPTISHELSYLSYE